MSPSPFSEKSRDTWCIKQKYQDNTLLSLLYVCLDLTYQKIPPPPPPHQPTCIEINLQSKRQEYSNSKPCLQGKVNLVICGNVYSKTLPFALIQLRPGAFWPWGTQIGWDENSSEKHASSLTPSSNGNRSYRRLPREIPCRLPQKVICLQNKGKS